MASTISSFDDGGDSATGSKTTTTTTTGKIIESVSREPEHENSTGRWRSVTEQRAYSSKLAEALRTSRSRAALASSSTSSDLASNSYIRTRAVRETADRVLAAAAKGRTRWSRAILTTRMRLSRMNHRKAKAKSTPSPVESRQKKSESGGGLRRRRRLPVLQRRVRDLGRLIPGCRRLPLPNLLDETTDYIAALENAGESHGGACRTPRRSRRRRCESDRKELTADELTAVVPIGVSFSDLIFGIFKGFIIGRKI